MHMSLDVSFTDQESVSRCGWRARRSALDVDFASFINSAKLKCPPQSPTARPRQRDESINCNNPRWKDRTHLESRRRERTSIDPAPAGLAHYPTSSIHQRPLSHRDPSSGTDQHTPESRSGSTARPRSRSRARRAAQLRGPASGQARSAVGMEPQGRMK